jgi:hypothetical protein
MMRPVNFAYNFLVAQIGINDTIHASMNTRRLFLFLFIISLYALTVRYTTDPDMWWHLRTGEAILADGIPRQDIFSFTADHHPWVTHEWLAQVMMWRLFQLGGLTAPMLFFAAVTSVTFLLVYAVSPGRPYLAALVTLLAATASNPLWGVRPQMLTLLFMALFVYIVEQAKNGRLTPRAFWWFPLLTVIWVNLHSGYLLGVVLLAVYTVGEGLQRWQNPQLETLSWSALRWLGAAAVACFLAAALNPNGVEIWIYPFLTLGSAAMQTYIVEWHSPDFHQIHFWPFIWLMALGVLSWRISPRQPTWSEMLLFGGTAVAGLISARHIPLFTVAAAPIVARHLFYASANHTRLHRLLLGDGLPRPTKAQKALNYLILLLALLAVSLWVADKAVKNEAVIAETYPVAAVDFLYENDLAESRIFNSYGWGGYLIWREIPVYIDGRADVYGDQFIFDYLRTYFGHERWRESLDNFAIEYVLIQRGGVLATLLLDAPEWELIYEDDLTRIFRRL